MSVNLNKLKQYIIKKMIKSTPHDIVLYAHLSGMPTTILVIVRYCLLYVKLNVMKSIILQIYTFIYQPLYWVLKKVFL